MLSKNDILELSCSSLGSNMEGVCHTDDYTVFVPGMLPDETGTVRIVKVQNRIAFGIPVSLSSSSPERLAPDCDAYPKCGGCSCRHMSYAFSLEAKQKQVQHCFHSIGHIDLTVPPVLGMEHPFHYRNKSSFPIGGEKNAPLLGFYAPRSHRIVPVSSCINAMEPTNSLLSAFLSWMTDRHIAPYHEENHTGLLRHIVVRINRNHEAMVTLVARKRHVPYLDDLIERLAPLGMTSLVLNINDQPTNVILGSDYIPVYGPGTLHDRLLDLDFELSPASFFQVNVEQAEKIYSIAREYAALTPETKVLDLYCGTGTISLILASQCRLVIGVEVVPQAIENAHQNAIRNGLDHAEFRVGRAEQELPLLVSQGFKPDVIVVDPPRKGLDPSVINTVCSIRPERIVYVSCNPATLARDAAIFHELGYDIQKIQCVDMFCWTSDVETVCLLSKIKSAPHIDINLDMTELDVTAAETKATYEEIKAYVLEHTGLKVSCLYIAQVKAKHGIIERDCYNKAKTEGNRVPKCPPEKERAIEEALRHFQMIP